MSRKLSVGNLPVTTTEDELRTLFERYGRVERVSLVVDRRTGRPLGFAFVEMTDLPAADTAAHELEGHPLGGRALRVEGTSERAAVGDRSRRR